LGKNRGGVGEVRKQRSKEVMMERRRRKERKRITQRRRGHGGALRRVGKVFESWGWAIKIRAEFWRIE
jgi:hypothetical protein